MQEISILQKDQHLHQKMCLEGKGYTKLCLGTLHLEIRSNNSLKYSTRSNIQVNFKLEKSIQN